MNMILVVFDIDGTLTNTKEVDDVCFLESLKECWQCDLGEVDWSTYLNVTDTGLAKEIFRSFFKKELEEEELNKFRKVFFSKIFRATETNPEGFREIGGASEFLKLLQENGVGISFATGGWRATAEHKLKQIRVDLNSYPYATSDDHFTRREILLRAIEKAREKYEKDFNKIIYVGDGIWDLQVATQLNIGFIGIDDKGTGKLARAGASYVYSNFRNTDTILAVIKNEELK